MHSAVSPSSSFPLHRVHGDDLRMLEDSQRVCFTRTERRGFDHHKPIPERLFARQINARVGPPSKLFEQMKTKPIPSRFRPDCELRDPLGLRAVREKMMHLNMLQQCAGDTWKPTREFLGLDGNSQIVAATVLFVGQFQECRPVIRQFGMVCDRGRRVERCPRQDTGRST